VSRDVNAPGTICNEDRANPQPHGPVEIWGNYVEGYDLRMAGSTGPISKCLEILRRHPEHCGEV
jgi:hypothetical protein